MSKTFFALTWPRSYGSCCFIQTSNRTLHKRFMTILLANGNHCMLACRHGLLANRPVTAHISWIHARIVGRLQSTFIARTFLKLTRAVRPRCDHTQIIHLRWRAIAHDCLRVTEKFISYAKLEGCLLLNRWGVKHLRKGSRKSWCGDQFMCDAVNGVGKHREVYRTPKMASERVNFFSAHTFTDAVTVEVSLKYCWMPVAVPHHDPPVKGRPSSLSYREEREMLEHHSLPSVHVSGYQNSSCHTCM